MSAGVSPTGHAVSLGFSKGTFSQWKKGSKPQNKALKTIADSFGITVEELVSDQKEKPVTSEDDELKILRNEIMKCVDKLSPEELKIFRAQVKAVSQMKEE